MTSQFEGLPVALLEAMSAECAVAATAAGGIQEVVRPGVDGLLAPVSSPSELIPHLQKLVEDPGERNRLSVAARVRVQSQFSLKPMTIALEQLYERLAASPRS
jgi:glycosyltransferase involved in cell wall biosynthesis